MFSQIHAYVLMNSCLPFWRIENELVSHDTNDGISCIPFQNYWTSFWWTEDSRFLY